MFLKKKKKPGVLCYFNIIDLKFKFVILFCTQALRIHICTRVPAGSGRWGRDHHGSLGLPQPTWNPPLGKAWQEAGAMEPRVSVWNVKTGVLSHLGALKNSTPSEPPTSHIGVSEGDISIFKAVLVILMALKLQ